MNTTTNAPTITTVKHNASFNFRNWILGQAGHSRLAELLESGKLAADDILVTKDKEGNEAKDQYQRKPVALELEVPLVSSFVLPDTLTPQMMDHLQALINQTVEKAQSAAVDAGIQADEGALKTWQQVLAAPFKQRTAAVKVTEEMIKAAVAIFSEYLEEVGSSIKAIELISALASKKFALTACVKVKRPVLEKIQERVAGFWTGLSDTDQHQHTATINLWAANLEKAINPETEDEIDEDMI